MMSSKIRKIVAMTPNPFYRGTTSGSQSGIHKRSLYEHGGVAICSQRKALIIASVFLVVLFSTSLAIAYFGPQNVKNIWEVKQTQLTSHQPTENTRNSVPNSATGGSLKYKIVTADCPCIGMKPLFLTEEDGVNASRSIIPIATNGEIFPWNNLRLPTFVRPERYHINIHPNLTTLEVKGQTSIDFHVEKPTEYIVFHSKNLTITEKILINRKNEEKIEIKINKMLEYSAGQQVFLELDEELQRAENYTLTIKYTTRLGTDLEGFYLSSYVTRSGEKKYLATTHFEPTYARSAFPCFDEPQFKARFKMSILRDRFHISLFNMPIRSTDDIGFYMGTGLVRDDFYESVEMSTYLVAFVVCDYNSTHTKTSKNVTVSVYAPTDLLKQASFALNTATKMMEHYEDFFGVPYPLPKQDLIAIPDFGAGAMENWGLITYRETSILYDEEETSAAANQWVAVVVAHELAHQWFGNLVTMRWWNDLWLNEGFASFLEYVGVDHVNPGWNMMDQFILDKTQHGLRYDALSTSHPISVTVHDPVEIEAIFDSISYSKGAAILNMMEKFLTQNVLRRGLNDYLNTHKYGNADTKDLWTVLSKHTNQSLEVKSIMDTWTRQMGFPLVTIRRENATSGVFSATQSRFQLTEHVPNITISRQPTSPFKYRWYIPLNYYTDKSGFGKVENVWMNMTNVTFEVDPKVVWIKANVNQSGFYRVNYSPDLWEAIITQLEKDHTAFTPADRASLIDDAFVLSRAGVLNVTLPLRLGMYLRHERNYVPWATALEHLQQWSKYLSEASPYRLFHLYMKYLLEPVAKEIGWDDSGPHLQKLLRSDVLSSAVLYEVEPVTSDAKNKFKHWMLEGKPTSIPPNLREVIYSAGIKYGGVKEWQYCWARYNATRVPSERRLLLKVLGAASDSWILQRYLLSTLNRDMIKPQDVKTVLGIVAANPDGHLLAWRYLKTHWYTLQSLFGNGTFTMGGLITAVTSHFASEFDFKDVSDFFRPIDVGSGTRALQQSLEMIQLNVYWVKQNEETIFKWLTNNPNFKY